MRVVLDTNVYISAFIFPGGAPDEIIRLAIAGEIQIVTSEPILTELARVFTDRFRYSEEKAERYVNFVRVRAQMVVSQEEIQEITSDPSDNRVLECAVAGDADYIVTGDKKHILPLGEFHGIPIVGPRKFLSVFYKEEGS